MPPLSEQSSQFLNAKNVSIQSVVKEIPVLDAEPIKYGEQFFEMLNAGSAGRSKAQVKEEYVQKNSIAHDSYLQ